MLLDGQQELYQAYSVVAIYKALSGQLEEVINVCVWGGGLRLFCQSLHYDNFMRLLNISGEHEPIC